MTALIQYPITYNELILLITAVGLIQLVILEIIDSKYLDETVLFNKIKFRQITYLINVLFLVNLLFKIFETLILS